MEAADPDVVVLGQPVQHPDDDAVDRLLGAAGPAVVIHTSGEVDEDLTPAAVAFVPKRSDLTYLKAAVEQAIEDRCRSMVA